MEQQARTADPLDGLAGVAWERLHHAYGTAEDVPGQLRALTSLDERERRAAYGALYGNVYHQGTRWEASPYVVPFLVRLVDDLATPERGSVLELLRAIALGDRDDSCLPFAPDREFATAGRMTPERVRAAVLALYEYPEAVECDEDDMNAAVVVWARDCYRALSVSGDRIPVWALDPDVGVAARAAELLAWCPGASGAVEALLAVPGEAAPARASANLALAHLAPSPPVSAALTALLDAAHPGVRLTAAVALAFHGVTPLPDTALDALVDARSAAPTAQEFPLPWDRSLRGFAALALARLGLS